MILLSDGAPARIRTADLLITNQLLYQLSYKGYYFSSNYYFESLNKSMDKKVFNMIFLKHKLL